MLKIGIIGLGDIAQKAYLPIISRKNIALHLYTRNKIKLEEIGRQYTIKNLYTELTSLIASGIQAAFVHSTTATHYDIIEQLLNNNIHVYVDKPVTYDYASTEKLIDLANSKNLHLHVGFNRRYAPAYQQLKMLQEPNMIVMQKNRRSLPADVRTFIFDDFIHVIDTLLYLFPYPIEKLLISGKKKDNLLYHVVVQFISPEGCTAIGIMNRDSGTTEEKLEVFTANEKRVVYNVADTFILQNKNETKQGTSDWDPTLHKRGFEQIVDEFIKIIEAGNVIPNDKHDALLTHQICEEVVQQLIKL